MRFAMSGARLTRYCLGKALASAPDCCRCIDGANRYIGFRDRDHAQIGLARSRDGITGWERHPANPILRPGAGKWDADAVYKPFAVRDGTRWLLWYNGRRGGVEQIGVAIHDGEDLGF